MNDEEKTKGQLINELKELREELVMFRTFSSENIQIAGVLRDFKEIYENFYKSNPHPMWIYDLETLAFLDVNDAAIKHYGYSQEEFLSMTIKDIRPPEDIPALLENITKVTKGLDIAGTWRHIKKDGTLIYVEIISHTLNFRGRRAEIVMTSDITERKIAEEVLYESETKFRRLAEATFGGIAVTEKGKFIEVSDQFAVLFGYRQHELIGMCAADLIESAARGEAVEKILSGYDKPYESLCLRKDGSTFPVEVCGKNYYSQGRELRVTAIRDITQHKIAEEEKERILNLSNDLICIMGIDGYFKYVNPAWDRILGYSREELFSRSVFDFVHHDDRQQNYEDFFALVVSGKQTIGYENHLIHKDGSIRIFSWTGTPLPGKGLLYCIGHDITERKEAEKALKEREKELEIKSHNLEESNTALRVLLKRRDEDRIELEEKVLLNIKELVVPYLEKLRKCGLDERQSAYAGILESNLNDIISSFSYRLSFTYLNFTPSEIKVANLVKQGKTNKEIAEILNFSARTAAFHRERIRKKLGIKNKKTNLKCYLSSIN